MQNAGIISSAVVFYSLRAELDLLQTCSGTNLSTWRLPKMGALSVGATILCPSLIGLAPPGASSSALVSQPISC